MLKLEHAILNFIKSSKTDSGQDEMQARLKLLKKELLEIKKDPLEKNVFKYFEFANWADGKLKLSDTGVWNNLSGCRSGL